MSRPERHPPPTAGLTELVLSAAEGDQAAWDALVDRFAGLVWSIARAHRLSAADAADVSQTTWLRLVEHLGRIRDPQRGGAGLAPRGRAAGPVPPPASPTRVPAGTPPRGPFLGRGGRRPGGGGGGAGAVDAPARHG